MLACCGGFFFGEPPSGARLNNPTRLTPLQARKAAEAPGPPSDLALLLRAGARRRWRRGQRSEREMRRQTRSRDRGPEQQAASALHEAVAFAALVPAPLLRGWSLACGHGSKREPPQQQQSQAHQFLGERVEERRCPAGKEGRRNGEAAEVCFVAFKKKKRCASLALPGAEPAFASLLRLG